MSEELQLGKYKFYPYDDKIQRLLDELERLNRKKKVADDPDELDRLYRELADREAADPEYSDWKDD